jgi:hypothetical protein
MVGTAEIITLAHDILNVLNQEKCFLQDTKAERHTLEYLTMLVEQGYLARNLHHIPLTLQKVSEAEYDEDLRMIAQSKAEGWYFNNRFEHMEVGIDARTSWDIHNPGDGYVLLKDKTRARQTLQELTEYLANPTAIPEILQTGRFEITQERIEFLRNAYSNPAALQFVGSRYKIQDAGQLFGALFNTAEAFTRLDAAFGKESTLQYLKAKHDRRIVSQILDEVLDEENWFEAMESLYPSTTTSPPVERPAYAASGGSIATAAHAYAMQKHE